LELESSWKRLCRTAINEDRSKVTNLKTRKSHELKYSQNKRIKRKDSIIKRYFFPIVE